MHTGIDTGKHLEKQNEAILCVFFKKKLRNQESITSSSKHTEITNFILADGVVELCLSTFLMNLSVHDAI